MASGGASSATSGSIAFESDPGGSVGLRVALFARFGSGRAQEGGGDRERERDNFERAPSWASLSHPLDYYLSLFLPFTHTRTETFRDSII